MKIYLKIAAMFMAIIMLVSFTSGITIAAVEYDEGAVIPSYDGIINSIEKANDYYQSNVKYDEVEYGIPNFFWAKSVYHTGNMEAYYTTGIEAYRNYSTAWATSCNWTSAEGTDDKSEWKWDYDQSFNSKHILFADFQVCFQTYIDLYNIERNESKGTIDETNKIARAIEVMSEQVSRTNDDFWWWSDSLYATMPILTKLYNATGDEKYLDSIYRFWKYAKELMYDGPGGIPTDASGYTTSAYLYEGAEYSDPDKYAYLFYRDAIYVYPLKPNVGHENEKNFWARANGYIFAALAKVLQDLPDNYEHYDEFLNTYLEMAPVIRDCMRVDENGYGFWTQSMLQGYPTSDSNPNGYETSGTSLLTYGLAWGINSGVLSYDEYFDTVVRAWNYLEHIALQSDGMVGYVQYIGSAATTAMGPRNNQNFAVGMYLLAASEMSRLVGGCQGDIYPYLQKKMQGYFAVRENSTHYYKDGVIGEAADAAFVISDANNNPSPMLPIRTVAEMFNAASTNWDPATYTVTIKVDGKTISFTLSDNRMCVDGVYHNIPVSPVIKYGTTFIPVTAVAEALGKKVYMDEDNNTGDAVIVVGDKANPFYECDSNLLEMLTDMLDENGDYPVRPEQPVKDFAPLLTPVYSNPRGEKIKIEKATFSQEAEAHNPTANAIDDIPGTYWTSVGIAYAIVDLGKVTELSSAGVLFKTYDDTRTTPFSIYISNDNSTWELIGGNSSTTGTAKWLYLNVNKSAQYVKFQFNGNTLSNWNSVDGISLYEGDASSPTVEVEEPTMNKPVGTKVDININNVTFSQQPEAQNPGRNAFDGNSSTLWSSYGIAYVVIDLESTMHVSTVGVQFKAYDDARIIPYSIEVSEMQ